MRPDDAAQVLEELPAEQAERRSPRRSRGSSSAAKRPPDGSCPDMAETAPVLYVVDDHDHLVGSLPWQRLITADPTAPVRLLRQEEPVSVTPETDQEEVARLVAKYT